MPPSELFGVVFPFPKQKLAITYVAYVPFVAEFPPGKIPALAFLNKHRMPNFEILVRHREREKKDARSYENSMTIETAEGSFLVFYLGLLWRKHFLGIGRRGYLLNVSSLLRTGTSKSIYSKDYFIKNAYKRKYIVCMFRL